MIRLLDSADQGTVLTCAFGWETFHGLWQVNLTPRVLEALMRFLVEGLRPNYCLVGVRFRTFWCDGEMNDGPAYLDIQHQGCSA